MFEKMNNISSCCCWVSSMKFPFSFSRPFISLSSCSSRIMSIQNNSSSSSISVSTSTESDKQKKEPWLIVGLGNPGKKYNATRHNVGFEMVDTIAEAEGISMTTLSFKALFGKGFIGDVPVILAKPQTFMNSSGESVGAIVSYYKIPLKQVLVIFDDLDLPFAKMRLLPKGGHGGHNGLGQGNAQLEQYFATQSFSFLSTGSRKNIIDGCGMGVGVAVLYNKTACVESMQRTRMTVGKSIGRPPGKMDPVAFVLRTFTKQEREELNFTLQDGLEAVRILLVEGFDKSATFVNTAKKIEQKG